jgi:hypothetical protein
MSTAYTSYAMLIAELRQWCGERRTGIVYVTTDTNHSAQINIDKGEIVFLVCKGKLGAGALPLMHTIEGCRFRFAEGSVPASFRSPLPDTGKILSYLSSGGPPKADLGEKAKLSAAPAEEITDRAKSILEQALAEYIGPMVAIVCPEHFERVRDLKSAVEALAGEIPKPEHATRFKDEVSRKLGIH